MRVVPDKFSDLLKWDKKAFAHVATVGPHGEPQNNPVWFDVQDGKIRFSLTTDRQKVRNVERDPRIALSIMDPDNPSRRLEVGGKVTGVRPDPEKKFIDRMAQKYLGTEKYPWGRPDEDRVVIEVQPEHTTAQG
jgi:PPOX class probable F420-dependent enzyme